MIVRLSILPAALLVGLLLAVPGVASSTSDALEVVTAGHSGSRTEVRFHPFDPESTLFPDNLFTVADAAQHTGRRLELPLPACDQFPDECVLVSALNTLDGFNLQPRVAIPFTGPIDLESLSDDSLFLVRLESWKSLRYPKEHPEVIALDRWVWDPAGSTLYAEASRPLRQHQSYALVVTDGVRDAEGRSIRRTGFLRHFLNLWAGGHERTLLWDVLQALATVRRVDVPMHRVVGLSVFTTQSVTPTLEAVARQIHEAPAPAAHFDLFGTTPQGSVFSRGDLADIVFRRQVGVTVTTEESFVDISVPLVVLEPDAVGALAFGRFSSPQYREPESLLIPPYPTGAPEPVVFGVEAVQFNLFLPAGAQPAGGWPVVLYSHGDGAGMHFDPFLMAGPLAAEGLALLAFNAPGYGGGLAGELVLTRTDGSTVRLPAGGRGRDLNGDGRIGTGEFDVSEGYRANGLPLTRDGRRQTVIDLLQAVRMIQAGVDVDGDGAADLDPNRISSFGLSLGGYHGPILQAIEPAVATGFVTVGGGSLVDLRMVPEARPDFELALALQQPPLTNVGDPASCLGPNSCDLRFDEDIPFPGEPPVADPVPGSLAIQEFFERLEWLSQRGNPIAYARHLRLEPLGDSAPRSVHFQLARGDMAVPNPGTNDLLRAGDLLDHATLYHHQLVFDDPARPAAREYPDGHFLPLFAFLEPQLVDIGLAASAQWVAFLASDGAVVLDPDGAAPVFETPIAPPLPEGCGFVIELDDFPACR
ncbi:MAG: hypothetical protein AAGC60_19530 [Acidobacteriota bacterium]